MFFSWNSFVFFLFFPSVVAIAVSLKRSPGVPKYFHQARSLIVCRTKCANECNDTVLSFWQRISCNNCIQYCIPKENMVYEDGPQDRGLIVSVALCCERLVTYFRISAKITFHYSINSAIGKAFAVLEYRVLSDMDDLHDPIWILSQITREYSLIITDLECGYLYQFRITLITTRIIDRRTSSWTSYRELCGYALKYNSENDVAS